MDGVAVVGAFTACVGVALPRKGAVISCSSFYGRLVGVPAIAPAIIVLGNASVGFGHNFNGGRKKRRKVVVELLQQVLLAVQKHLEDRVTDNGIRVDVWSRGFGSQSEPGSD